MQKAKRIERRAKSRRNRHNGRINAFVDSLLTTGGNAVASGGNKYWEALPHPYARGVCRVRVL